MATSGHENRAGYFMALDGFDLALTFVFADGALPKKFKLLIGMAFDASHGAVGGVKG